MAYNSISIKPYIKSHLELQRDITLRLMELAPSPYLFVQSFCLAYIIMFARFDENPAMTLQDIKETKLNGLAHGQRENSLPTTNKVCGGYKQCGPRTDCFYRSSLIWVHTVCHGGFLNISADDFCCDWRFNG